MRGADVTSIKRAGRIATFGFAVGAGLLLASGASAAVAAAAPEDSGHASSSHSSAANNSSSARSARPSSATTGKPKPARVVTTGTDYSASVVQLQTKRAAKSASATSAVTLTAPVAKVSDTPTPTATAKQTPANRLPTPAQIHQDIVAGLDAARRNLDTLRQNIGLLIKHQIEGIQDNLTTLRYDLAAIIGPNRPPVNPDIPPDDTPNIIGKPADKVAYFLYQEQTNRCVLMSTAMVIGQLLGKDKMPTADEITQEAATTPSSVAPDVMMYDPVKDGFVYNADALQLLENHGITATSTQYSKGQGTLALDNLKSALTAGNSVIVTVNADIAWGRAAPGGADTADHAITVLGIDTAKNLVYVNDSAFRNGAGIGMKMDVFMAAWKANDFQTITASVTPVQESAVAA